MLNPRNDYARSDSITFFVLLGAGLFAFIETFSLLSPIILSLLLILLISLAVNPLISRMRAWTGGRKIATGLITVTLVVMIALIGWAFFVPMKASVAKLSQHFWKSRANDHAARNDVLSLTA